MNKRMWVGLPSVSPGRYMVDATDYDSLAAELAGLRREHSRVWEERKAVEAAVRWCLLYMTDDTGALRAHDSKKLTPPSEIKLAIDACYYGDSTAIKAKDHG